MNERRRKLVPVSSIFIAQHAWATNTVMHIKCIDGLPADATFIALTYDPRSDIYYFCYQSSEWDEVPNEMMLPIFNPQFMGLNVAPFLDQAEKLIEHCADGTEHGSKWLEEYRAFKEQTGYPNGD